LSAVKASVSGIAPSAPKAASEPRLVWPFAATSTGQPIAAAGSGCEPHAQVSASGWPALTRP
jgi:hypothetical protein